jgi:hypothetical protein
VIPTGEHGRWKYISSLNTLENMWEDQEAEGQTSFNIYATQKVLKAPNTSGEAV